MRVPTRKEAELLVAEAEKQNPGGWIDHVRYAGDAAERIATKHPDLDPEVAYVLGLLHDIGRRVGRTSMRHTIDGYQFLLEQGFADAARICITHAFPYQNIHAMLGEWDCTAEELSFAKDYLAQLEYNDYDRLIQLCDHIALPYGFCILEKRMIDAALRRGVNDYSVKKWRVAFEIKEYFERMIGCSIYSILPGVVENTFSHLR